MAPACDLWTGREVPLGAPLDVTVCVAAEAEDRLAPGSVASSWVYLRESDKSELCLSGHACLVHAHDPLPFHSPVLRADQLGRRPIQRHIQVMRRIWKTILGEQRNAAVIFSRISVNRPD